MGKLITVITASATTRISLPGSYEDGLTTGDPEGVLKAIKDHRLTVTNDYIVGLKDNVGNRELNQSP